MQRTFSYTATIVIHATRLVLVHDTAATSVNYNHNMFNVQAAGLHSSKLMWFSVLSIVKFLWALQDNNVWLQDKKNHNFITFDK